MPGPRIDIHPHVISPDTARYPLAPVGGKRSAWSASSHSLTPDQLIAAMDDAGVRKAAVVQSSTTYGYDNNLVADAVAAHPDRLTGVCSIDMLSPDAVATLRHWMDRGCTGLRLFTTASTMPGQAGWLNDPATCPVWQLAAEVGMAICIQARIEGLAMLRDMMERFPSVPIVLDHIGHPDLSDGPPYDAAGPAFALAPYEQLVVKLTPHNVKCAREGRATPETFLPRLVEVFGPGRIAWGSNYPASPGTLSESIKDMEAVLSFLAQDDLDRIMGGNAARLYPALSG